MNKAARTVRPTRIRLPEELSGDFTGVVTGTFGAALDFAEMQFFRQFPQSVVNRIVLADQHQLALFLGSQPPLRRLNRSYVASPVRSPHAHHPKYVMLVGPKEGRLFVGSGNLSIGGYAGPGECFTAHEWHADDVDGNPSPFGAVRELIEATVTAGWVDAVTQERLRDIFKAAPWVPASGGADSPVVHNQARSLLDQLVERVGDAKVLEVVAAAPFHDRSADAVNQIVQRLEPKRFRLLVQEGMTRLDVGALGSVLSTVQHVEILEASAPHPYPSVLLHAKLVLVRTETADILLQGSANLSRVALCEFGSNGNVEIGNLLRGAPGEFDGLLESLDLETRSEGLSTFKADDGWGDGDDDAPPGGGPTNVTWAPPTLSGELSSSLAQHIEVRVGERAVVAARTTWETVQGRHHFSLEFSETDAARVDFARHIELIDANDDSWTVYPYHLHSLLRLTASGGRADLLQEAGDLDLRDKELEELVAELDRVLVVDGRSLWRLAHPEQPSSEGDQHSDGPNLSYDDLDWSRLGSLPQLRQYGSAAHRALLAPTELGLILQSLTNRFRADAGVRTSSGDVVDDSGDLGAEPESENEDELDDTSGSDDEEESGGRRMAPRQRVRRLWRNFVNRFIRGLADDDFIRSVGSPVIIPTYVVFNHLCRRLRVIDLVDADFLTDVQTRLWSFMWGDVLQDGYLADLPPEELVVARKILAEHDDLQVTLAAVDDVWWHVWENDLPVFDLRTAFQKFLGSGLWDSDPEAFRQAAGAALRSGDSVERLFENLYSLAAFYEEFEMVNSLASCLGVPASEMREIQDTVMRGGVRSSCTLFRIESLEMTSELAARTLALWHHIAPDADYLRLETKNAIAAVDLEHDHGFYFDRQSRTDVPLRLGVRVVPNWEVRLEELATAN